MWLIGEYESVTLFSLKPSSATASGGKTLLIPTPYAFKMALLDAACRFLGIGRAENIWPQIRDLQIAIRPAEKVLVTNLFQKVLKPRRNPPRQGEQDYGPFQKTIGYREYAQSVGPIGVAIGWRGVDQREWLVTLFLNINYLGKRGGFIQLMQLPNWIDELPGGYVVTTHEQTLFNVDGTLQILDDCASSLTFAKANIYSKEKVQLGKDRITRSIVLPYRITRSSKSFTLYECIHTGL